MYCYYFATLCTSNAIIIFTKHSILKLTLAFQLGHQKHDLWIWSSWIVPMSSLYQEIAHRSPVDRSTNRRNYRSPSSNSNPPTRTASLEGETKTPSTSVNDTPPTSFYTNVLTDDTKGKWIDHCFNKSVDLSLQGIQRNRYNHRYNGVAPKWVDANTCMRCNKKFNILRRKHHCRGKKMLVLAIYWHR